MQEHLIIIGGVAAGAKAAAKARRESPDLKISVYEEGEYISYSACGLPYFIEGEVKDYHNLLVRSPEKFKEKENIDIYLRHKVTKILLDIKKIEVEKIETGEKFEVEYSKLLIATGARPFVPEIEGIRQPNVFTLRTVNDAKAIKEKLASAKKAAIIGAGYIGLEMAEAMYDHIKDITIVEQTCHVLPALDPDMADLVQKYLEEEKGIKLVCCDRVERLIEDSENKVTRIVTSNGQTFEADIIILAIGVKPNTELAKSAGIEIGETGAIRVSDRMETSFPDIYAAGDCAEQTHAITGKPVWIPLGSTANKQGRVAAINMTGGTAKFKGVTGSLIVKVFDYTVTKTGLGETEAQKNNYNYEIAIVPHKDKAGYITGSENITIKLLGDKITRKLLGAQIIGKGNADKRINIVATALSANMTVDEFLDVDLAYAPPYSTAIDPILTAAQVLQNKLDKKAEGISFQELENYLKENHACCLIDVREIDQYKEGHIKGAKNIPFDEIDEEKIRENPENKVIVYCQEGRRAYLTSLKLKDKGFEKLKFVDGGISTCTKKLEKV